MNPDKIACSGEGKYFIIVPLKRDNPHCISSVGEGVLCSCASDPQLLPTFGFGGKKKVWLNDGAVRWDRTHLRDSDFQPRADTMVISALRETPFGWELGQWLPGRHCRTDSSRTYKLEEKRFRFRGHFTTDDQRWHHSRAKSITGGVTACTEPQNFEEQRDCKAPESKVSVSWWKTLRSGLTEQLSQAGTTGCWLSPGCFAAHRAVARGCRRQELLDSNREDWRPRLTQFPKSLHPQQSGNFKSPFIISLKSYFNH